MKLRPEVEGRCRYRKKIFEGSPLKWEVGVGNTLDR